MKTNKIDLTRLRNEEHFQFMNDVKGLIEITGVQILNIEQLYLTLSDLFRKEDIALEVIRKNKLTDPITEADTQRYSIYRGFVLLIEAYSHSTNTTKVQASHNIKIIIDHYGSFRFKSYIEETASAYNLIQDINTLCKNDVLILNIQDWINELSTANQTFDDLMNQRFDDRARQEIINLRETRKAIDAIYTQITDLINASILVHGETSYSDFVNSLNERINYFKHTITIRKGKATAKKNNIENKNALH